MFSNNPHAQSGVAYHQAYLLASATQCHTCRIGIDRTVCQCEFSFARLCFCFCLQDGLTQSQSQFQYHATALSSLTNFPHSQLQPSQPRLPHGLPLHTYMNAAYSHFSTRRNSQHRNQYDTCAWTPTSLSTKLCCGLCAYPRPAANCYRKPVGASASSSDWLTLVRFRGHP